MKQVWKANQIVQGNGAYGGKTVSFIDPDAGLVIGQLRRSDHSTEKPGNVLFLVCIEGDNDWYTLPNDSLVEVTA